MKNGIPVVTLEPAAAWPRHIAGRNFADGKGSIAVPWAARASDKGYGHAQFSNL